MALSGTEFLLQWNTRSLVSHWTEFREYMTNKKPLLAALQETRFLDSDTERYTFNLSGYSLYTNNVNAYPRRGGSAIYRVRTVFVRTSSVFRKNNTVTKVF